ncbi:non-specific serine/threonine protein kinase [Trifolium repens]|nr:non-specific serine/threonine protein kinase [Trifolium repens]
MADADNQKSWRSPREQLHHWQMNRRKLIRIIFLHRPRPLFPNPSSIVDTCMDQGGNSLWNIIFLLAENWCNCGIKFQSLLHFFHLLLIDFIARFNSRLLRDGTWLTLSSFGDFSCS